MGLGFSVSVFDMLIFILLNCRQWDVKVTDDETRSTQRRADSHVRNAPGT